MNGMLMFNENYLIYQDGGKVTEISIDKITHVQNDDMNWSAVYLVGGGFVRVDGKPHEITSIIQKAFKSRLKKQSFFRKLIG